MFVDVRMYFCWVLFRLKAILWLSCYAGNIYIYICIHFNTIYVIRNPCAATPSSKDSTWDLSQWLPLISDRSFLPWLVKVPLEAEVARSRYMTMSQITDMEEMWKVDAAAEFEDLGKAKEEETQEVEKVLDM